MNGTGHHPNTEPRRRPCRRGSTLESRLTRREPAVVLGLADLVRPDPIYEKAPGGNDGGLSLGGNRSETWGRGGKRGRGGRSCASTEPPPLWPERLRTHPFPSSDTLRSRNGDRRT